MTAAEPSVRTTGGDQHANGSPGGVVRALRPPAADPPEPQADAATSPAGLPRPRPATPGTLAGPVPVALAKAVEQVPTADSLPGGCAYELKWDGFRLVVVREVDGARLWSRQGKDLTARFHDIARAAAAQLAPGAVVDGKLVIWADDRLDFGLLQRRLVTGLSGLPALVRAHPASFVVFDLLSDAGRDVLTYPCGPTSSTVPCPANWLIVLPA